ncbi:hypothetical protein J7426_10660 [Tropicibacter sp. R16_0]|uniref:calcium-binding protein n=1 Tax=Tropicibacter sp. R16_0 TaxID=2821102 RepID=UPI001ADAE2D5|nr:calcium-binding protein [Tropicibacter sp. R16_0]MBO9450721.1 hypothetical protein [Tropicibacter sp. R16_0]
MATVTAFITPGSIGFDDQALSNDNFWYMGHLSRDAVGSTYLGGNTSTNITWGGAIQRFEGDFKRYDFRAPDPDALKDPVYSVTLFQSSNLILDAGDPPIFRIDFDPGFTEEDLRRLGAASDREAFGDLLYGNDVLHLTDGNDRVSGRAGYDWFFPGHGNDTLDGGSGRDMVSYSGLEDIAGRGTDFFLNLDLTAGVVNVFGGETDQLISIERATGSSYADVMRGTNGNDDLRGIGDYDWFIATAGRDTIDGGGGLDMITFIEAGHSGAPVVRDIFDGGGAPPTGRDVGGIALDLENPSNNTGLASGLTLTSVERVTGSSHQDVFYGDAQQNDFRGLGGYDWFVGSTGGRERYFGGDGLDTVTYFQSTSGVSASLRNGAGLFGGQETGYGSAGDAVRDLYFEIENLVGTNFDDSLTGNNERNQLSGLDGDDFLFGYGGIDYLKGGAGNDTLNGGAGSDFAIFDGNRADYTITRTSATDVTVTGADGTDSLISVEYFQFDDETANIWQFSIA